MPITIRPIGSLKRFIAPDTVLDNVHTIGEAVAQLSLPEDMGLVMLVNGRTTNWNTVLADGDILQLIPVISGG
jgi:molybdopterin converting factor small subunit